MPDTTPSQARTQAEWGDLARSLLFLDASGATRRFAVAGILRVLTRGSAAPPSSPAPVEGDMHLLGAGANVNQLAYRTAAGAWQYHAPSSLSAWQVSVVSEAGRVYQWTGAAWAPIDTTAAAAAAAAQATADAALPAAGASFSYTQASPATTWIVNHNLGRNPIVEVRTVGGALVEADVIHTSINQVVITFATAFAGTARCV